MYPTKKDQEAYDLCLEYVDKAIKSGTVDINGEATGPEGHLAVAVSNLLDAATSEVYDDAEVRSIVRRAKAIVNLGS